MAAFFLPLLALLAALAGGYYQLHLKGVLDDAGVWRTVQPHGTDGCTVVTALPACEKIVLHQPTGAVYAACSTLAGRLAWMPALHSLNASARSHTDFVAVLDPRTGASTRLALAGLADARGLSVHGMDVVPSAADPAELFVYLVNHRPAADGTATDPSVEVFRTIHGGRVLEHVRTYADAGVMRSPNDVVGAPDGQSFWFTNDGSHLRGFAHAAQIYLGTARGSIGFCSAAGGCRFAAEKIQGANGLARVSDDVFFLGNALRGELRVLERQADDSLVVTDLIKHDMPVDNLSVDKDGAVWAAGFPKGLDLMRKHFPNPSLPAATTAIRITLNTGRSAFFGEKYKLEKAFESDGTEVASGTTTVVHDAARGKLIMSGIMAPGITVCDFPASK